MPTRIQSIFIVSICLALFACNSEPNADQVQEAATPKEIGSMDGISNTVYRYDENIYRGGDVVSQAGMDGLKSMGVKTIFSVTPTDDERAFAKKSGIKLVETPFTKEGIPGDKLPVYLQLMKSAEKPFYVHCHSGKNRGGTLLAAYRVHHQDWSLEKAKEEFIELGGKDAEFPELMNSIKKTNK